MKQIWSATMMWGHALGGAIVSPTSEIFMAIMLVFLMARN
jgi:hypothetical protein